MLGGCLPDDGGGAKMRKYGKQVCILGYDLYKLYSVEVGVGSKYR